MTEVQALSRFLTGKERPQETLTYHQLQGFLFAVTCAPEPVPPSEWVDAIFDGEDPRFAGEREAQEVSRWLIRLHDDIDAGDELESVGLPADCAFRDPTLANFEPEAPICQWSQGFMGAMEWLQEAWDRHVEEDDESLGSLMLVLGLFVARDFAQSVVEEGEPRDERGRTLDLAGFAEAAREGFEDAMFELAEMGQTLRSMRPDDDEAPEDPPPTGPPPGRPGIPDAGPAPAAPQQPGRSRRRR